LIGSDRGLTNRKLANWYTSVGAVERYPGIIGFGYVRFVPASQLPSFTAQLRADPVPGLALRAGPIKLEPSGRRPYYCLARLGLAGAVNQFLLSPGIDYCAIPGFSGLQSARDADQFVSFTLGGKIVAVFAPIYQGGTSPATIALRRARIVGVVAELFDVRNILGQALAGHRELQVSVAARGLPPSPAASTGIAGQFAASVAPLSSIASIGPVTHGGLRKQLMIAADGGWVVTIAKPSNGAFLSPNAQAVAVLAGGAIVSLLAFLLVQTLSSGRARAMRTVQERTRQLRHQALHDGLTGLPNRGLLLKHAAQMLERARTERTSVAAMYIDIDGFKGVNDSFGHLAGDQLLREVATRISEALRSTDTIGRIGGDEFVVLVEGGKPGGDPQLLAERLLTALRAPFELDGPERLQLLITASIGVALGDRPAAAELLRDADIALYRAKTTGKNRIVVFRREMHLALQDRVSLENDLRRAIDKNELELAYQPTFELCDGGLTGVEALLRWHHPVRGMLGAAEFVSIAEDSGLIVELGSWVIHHACAQAAQWSAAGCGVDVSVNVSARQLDDPGLLDVVARALRVSGLPSSALALEITETALMRAPELSAARLQALKRLGVRIAIDDFGTGYSSLAYLHQFPVDALKIDQAFVSGIGRSQQTEALIRALVQLATALNIDTVAEGIEVESQRGFLVDAGCRQGQGFLYSRPLDAAATQAFLRERVIPRFGVTAAVK
jgi:diguanylate cyclase (GGDEF)-like protein